MARDNDMISPFEDKQVRGDKISFGVSSYGYDARVSDEFKIFTPDIYLPILGIVILVIIGLLLKKKFYVK